MLKAIGLGKEFDSKVALNDVDLTFPQKGLVIIKGESGSGKTTLLNLLTALDYPTRGKIEFDGVEITPKNAEQFRMKYCGNIYQDYMLIEDLSIKDNIEIALQACGQDYTDEDIQELLSKVDLPAEYIDKKTSKLSGGEKQRVAIARAIAKKQAMIFADEPTGNLDGKNAKVIMDLLKEISQERLVVVVSHNEKHNIQYADYTVELEDGIVISCNLPDQDDADTKAVNFDGKSRLKPKTLARLAFWGFEKNRVKTVVSMIVFVILSIFCLISTVAFIGDANLAYSRSLNKCKQKNVFFNINTDTIYYNNKDFDFENLDKFRENVNYGSSKVYLFYFFDEIYYKDNQKRRELSELYSHTPAISQAIIYNRQIGADVEVLHGDFPKEYNDIMLPHCYAKYISQVLLDFKCDDIANLIGRELKFAKNMLDADIEYFNFKICGIFEEGDYYTDYNHKIDSGLSEYYFHTNYMARSAILSPESEEIMFNNAYLFNKMAAYNFCKFYDTTSIADYNICPYAYDKYNSYANKYEPLKEGEVYIDKAVAQTIGLKIGDRLTDTLLKQLNMSTGEITENDFDGLVVKDIFELPDKMNFVIFSQQDYYDTIIFNHVPGALWGYYFNAKNINDTYRFFNNVLQESSKLEIYTNGYSENVHTENLNSTDSIYTILVAFKYVVWLPFMLLTYIGMVAMGFVSFSYLISSKSKAYNVLRSLGFGKRNISLLLFLQVFVIILAECIIGIFLGWLSCDLLGKAIVSFANSGVPLSIASEVLLPIGYIAPMVLLGASLLLGGAIVLLKTRSLFAKSIMENKTS